MIWLTWRQQRLQTAVVAAGVLALAAVLLLTGTQLAALSDTTGTDFLQRLSAGRSDATIFTLVSAALLLLPAVVGVFWGAPLVARELESGTHRLVWNQSVTRSRWLATKIALGALAAMALTAVLALLVTWWAGPIDAAIESGQGGGGLLLDLPRMAPPAFEMRGIVPVAYTALSYVVGVAAGLVLRRTVPAMAVTLVVFVLVHVAMPTFARSELGPVESTTAITADNLRGLMITGASPGGPVSELRIEVDSPGAWVVRNETVAADGRAAGELPGWVADCGIERSAAVQAACFDRLATEGYRQHVAYQPADRYWRLQAYESAVLAAMSLLILGFSFWWLRRRTS